MAEASISVDQLSVDQFSCPVCLDLLKDPVTIPCGHNYCMVCINGFWDQKDQKGVYSCPQCRDTVTPRPVLRRNNMLAEVVEKLKKAEVQAASPAHCSARLMRELKEEQMKSQQRIQEKQKKVQELKQAVNTIKLSTQTAVEDSERIFTEMISSMEKRCSEVTELIRAQEKAELSRAERLLEELEQEIADLQRRVTELEQLSHTDDHLHFLQSFQSLRVSSGREDSRSITVNQHLSFDGVRKSLSALKKRVEEFCQEEFIKIPEHAAAVQIILPPEPKSRQDFLQYFCDLTLDPNTVHYNLILSEKNRAVTFSGRKQQYSDHPERFDYYSQLLSKESVCGRCYWEVEWSGVCVYISVSYKDISRKGRGNEYVLGHNNQSWSLRCYSYSSLCFYHNDIKTDLRVPPSSRIGVYVDHSAGTLSFYSVSDTMKLLHRVHTTFTQPLYAGFWLDFSSTVRLRDPK
ncbi:hypothetical protein AMELA_G00016600 [Ameiurus melas]|uniref:Tripartite motif-containing protein 16-like n=1 Tax=Ameiurus melas TaxID=219545 RepID=A0A7J6BD73_AMEME|nr:hypothetical protein AMELA_G00016600 [Ameiurus melas]